MLVLCFAWVYVEDGEQESGRFVVLAKWREAWARADNLEWAKRGRMSGSLKSAREHSAGNEVCA